MRGKAATVKYFLYAPSLLLSHYYKIEHISINIENKMLPFSADEIFPSSKIPD